MKDLDFDELDRAVSSLLGATKSPATQSEKAATPTNTVKPQPFVTKPAEEAIEELPTAQSVAEKAEAVSVPSSPIDKSAQATHNTRPLATKRSSGRFMDVVHPSSDMKPSAASAPVSREGVTIAPSTRTPIDAPMTDGAGSLSLKRPQFAPNPPEGVAPVASNKTPEPKNEFPDPLDFHGFTFDDEPEKEEVPVATTQESSETPSNQDEVESTPAEDQKPLESPFVFGAQIEKRPLGAFAAGAGLTQAAADEVAHNDAPVEEKSQTVIETPNEEIAEPANELQSVDESDDDTQITPDAGGLPAELHEELLSIESTEMQPREEEIQPLVANIESRAQTTKPLDNGSIVQQYKTATAPKNTEQTPIYDTDAYHQPLKHPEKRKSGWLSVVLIIFIIAVFGAGCGAAFYYFMM